MTGQKTIGAMSPKEILVKEAFRRTLPSENLTNYGQTFLTGDFLAAYPEARDPLRYELVTQADFMREFDVNSHRINSLKYYPNMFTEGKDGEGKKRLFEKVKARVAVGFQERIWTKRMSALTGNNISLRISDSESGAREQENLSLFREGWETKDMETALYQAVGADGKTGDCALVFYLDGGRLHWRCFSFDRGDVLYPHYDPLTGRLALLGRRYLTFDSRDRVATEYLDVWDGHDYARYRLDRTGLRGAANLLLGDSGWVLEDGPRPHGFERIPAAYDRYGEPFWANSQALIEHYELGISHLFENNKAFAMRILYSFGEAMETKVSLDGTPTHIAGTDPNSKVGFLEPAERPGSYELQFNILEKNIMRSSFAVETPEIKSGADMSSLTVKMLYADSYQKAMLDAQHFQPFLNDVVELFKHGWGIESGRVSDMQALNVKAELYPYVFMSETETVSNIVQLVSIGALSRKSASEMAYQLGYGVAAEYDRLLKQEHDELAGTQGAAPRQDVNIVEETRADGEA